MSNTPHTPTPWAAYETGAIFAQTYSGPVLVAKAETPEDAAFIVQACNSHAALVEALTHAEKQFTALLQGHIPGNHRGALLETDRTRDVIRAALKLASS
jgi:hypothetical protein